MGDSAPSRLAANALSCPQVRRQKAKQEAESTDSVQKHASFFHRGQFRLFNEISGRTHVLIGNGGVRIARVVRRLRNEHDVCVLSRSALEVLGLVDSDRVPIDNPLVR